MHGAAAAVVSGRPTGCSTNRNTAASNPDITEAYLDRNGLANGYEHYLWRGNAEDRIAHALFDPVLYRAGLSPEEAEVAAADGPFWHCLRRLHRGRTRRYDCRSDSIRHGIATDIPRFDNSSLPALALGHRALLNNITPTESRSAVSAFSEAYYLARYDDAAEQVRQGQSYNGYAGISCASASPRAARRASQSRDLAWVRHAGQCAK